MSVSSWVPGRKYHLLIRCEDDYRRWNSLAANLSDKDYTLIPVAENNVDFFRANVFLSEEEILSQCGKSPMLYSRDVRPCYEAAFKLMHESGGAFNPRWRGPKTLDLGAIAKGFAVDVAAKDCYADHADALIDIGGNIKAVRGEGGSHRPWRTGVMDPNGGGFAAVVELREGEALATSATYYRGNHIYDGRTGLAVSNGVASVTVLCNSAMWADGLSTTLFVLGPDEGKKFLDDKLKLLVGDMAVSALWIMDGGRQEIYGNARFQGN